MDCGAMLNSVAAELFAKYVTADGIQLNLAIEDLQRT